MGASRLLGLLAGPRIAACQLACNCCFHWLASCNVKGAEGKRYLVTSSTYLHTRAPSSSSSSSSFNEQVSNRIGKSQLQQQQAT